MKQNILLFFLLLSTCLSFSQSKRGIAYGYHSPADLAILAPEISWWYNWSETPESSVADVYGDYGFDFVPMAWNGNFNETQLRSFLANHPETKYLLAFNEPNFIEQANMTPSQVAEEWSKLEAIAEDYNLEIVGPAVNYCGNCVSENGTTYTDPFKYLDDFFTACPDCKVDYIAVHSYMNTASALQWYIGEFKKYKKPIWLTEFAGWESNGVINNLNNQINFMIGAVDFLENDADVFRYSWFIGRASGIQNYPFIDILGANGQLTALGEVYKQMPVHDANSVIEIPKRIEAEAYNQMSGILLEKTDDENGFANVGYIEAGDWLEYKINVPATENYPLSFRVASTKSTSLSIIVNGTTLQTQSFSNTGGWQNWNTFTTNINLEEGQHTLRLQALTDGFNINWFQIGDVVSTVKKNGFLAEFVVYPNPITGTFRIKTTEQVIKIQIFELSGKMVKEMPFEKTMEVDGLSKGLYILKAIEKEGKILASRQISIK